MSDGRVAEISVEMLHALPASGAEIQVVDVRESWEWVSGHITGAMHIPLGELPARIGELDPRRDVAFICHLGTRSEMAARFGLTRAANVIGGMDAWTACAYDVE